MNQIMRPKRRIYRQDKERGGVFRIIIGVCIDNGPPGCDCDMCYTTPADERKANGDRGKNHMYEAYDTWVRRMAQESGTPEDKDRLTRYLHEGYLDPTYTNDLITSTGDLCSRYNSGRDGTKFLRAGELPGVSSPTPSTQGTGATQPIVPPAAPPAQPKLNLDALSLRDLQAYAAEEEVDLKGAKTKDEALKILKATIGG